ncbi:hypothetical protein ACTJKQ_13275 [Acidovorax sp. 22279]|uniref:hypothetical protein n=1 Tax=Acidovorax sp. 22279 TaxID=3453900 RepID=UPI003F8674BC
MTKIRPRSRAFGLALLAAVFSGACHAAPDPKAADAEADFQFAVKAAKLVKASAKDPSSFEVVQAGLVSGGPVCIVYRAKNSFNAVTTEMVAVRRNMSRGNWNKECARSGLTDVSHIRKAM